MGLVARDNANLIVFEYYADPEVHSIMDFAEIDSIMDFMEGKPGGLKENK